MNSSLSFKISKPVLVSINLKYFLISTVYLTSFESFILISSPVDIISLRILSNISFSLVKRYTCNSPCWVNLILVNDSFCLEILIFFSPTNLTSLPRLSVTDTVYSPAGTFASYDSSPQANLEYSWYFLPSSYLSP